MSDSVGQKRVKRNTHPLLQHRLAASANGWSINPCNGKDVPPRGWPTMSCSADAILSEQAWRGLKYMGTAARITGNLCVIDSDISIQPISDMIQAALEDVDPEGYGRAVIRDSGAVTLAVFYQLAQPPRHPHYATRYYTAHRELLAELTAARLLPETTEEESDIKARTERDVMRRLDPQRVEFYGGPAHRGRYFCYEGPHSKGRVYSCWEQAPWNTRVDDLPVLRIDPAAFIDRCDKIMGSHLTAIPERESSSAQVVYDLRPDMKFYPKGGRPDTIESLTESLAWGVDAGIRGCAPWTRASKSEANCKLYLTMSGRIVLTDWAAGGVNHYLTTDKPVEPVELDDTTKAAIEAFPQPHAREREADADAEPEPEPAARSQRRDDISRQGTPVEIHDRAVNWLIANVAFYPQAFKGRGGVVSIHPDGEFHAPITSVALRGAMANYGYTEIGPRGGQHIHNPVGEWSVHPGQTVVHGIRMRPEMERPLFREDGLLLINRYEAPVHPAKGGSVEGYAARLETLVPDPVERAWLVNWLAWKVQNPQCRGVAVAMVARDNGAGRGLLAETLQLVLGERFVVSMPYANISGGSKFNAEVEGKLLLYVNEAAPPEGQRWANKNAAREALKVFIEPNHRIPFRVEPKGVDAYYTRAAVSTMVFTNNINSLPLDEADRRITVLMNGPEMTVRESEQFLAWMAKPKNIGALYRMLRDHKVETDKAVFDPYRSARFFRGRDLMIEAAKTALDRAWDAALEKLATASELYGMHQIVKLTRYIANKHGSSDFDDLVEQHTVNKGCRVGIKNSTNWFTRFEGGMNAAAGDNRERVYAFTEDDAKKWTHATPDAIRAQLYKAQAVIDEPMRIFNKALHVV
jgi:hypothetical protein